MKNDFAKGNFFKKPKKEKVVQASKKQMIPTGNPLYYNQGYDICSQACSCCWDKPCPSKMEDQIEYLSKRIEVGHTSVLEHSNVVTYLQIPSKHYEDLITFLTSCKYLNTVCKSGIEYDGFYLILGGSYRAYRDVYTRIDNLENVVLKYMTTAIQNSIPKEVFGSMVRDRAINTDRFKYVEPEGEFNRNIVVDDNITVVNIDRLEDIEKSISMWCQEADLFDRYDLMELVTVTVLFRHMSRTGTHQLVRHRNAITQESQRYVDYSNAKFVSPDKFKPDRYSPDNWYQLSIGDGFISGSLSEIGTELMKVYQQLRDVGGDNNKLSLLKEDARAFLPSNVECSKIYMTFTFKSLFVFLKLREGKASQAEIRKYATTLGNWFRNSEDGFSQEEIDAYLLPKYATTPDPIDKYVETIGSLSVEDYIEAMPEHFKEED